MSLKKKSHNLISKAKLQGHFQPQNAQYIIRDVLEIIMLLISKDTYNVKKTSLSNECYSFEHKIIMYNLYNYEKIVFFKNKIMIKTFLFIYDN